MYEITSSHAPGIKGILSAYWHKEAYRSKPAELVLYFLTISGLVLWVGFDLP